MTNIYTCLRENKTSAKFGIRSPSLENYLNVSRNESYDGNDVCIEMITLLQTQSSW